MDKHISLARELGYEGQELRDYLKRQQDLERDERVAQREYEREKREADHKDKEREQNEKDRELEKLKIEAAQREKDKELELEKLKLQANQREKDKEMEKEVELKKIEAEVELKKMRPRPLHIPGGPKRKFQILGVPSFHTLTNIRIRWIAI